MQTVYLEPAMVPAHLRSGYNGTKFEAAICESVTVPADAGLWSNGSRDTYSLIRLADGAAVSAVNHSAAPWDEGRGEKTIPLAPGFAVVMRSMSAGKDMGLTFYVFPSDAAAMLPAPIELTKAERLVLTTTATCKASYGGRDRYQMAQENHHWTDDRALPFPTRAEWDATKAALVARGMLNKAGAITVKGRNAVG